MCHYKLAFQTRTPWRLLSKCALWGCSRLLGGNFLQLPSSLGVKPKWINVNFWCVNGVEFCFYINSLQTLCHATEPILLHTPKNTRACEKRIPYPFPSIWETIWNFQRPPRCHRKNTRDVLRTLRPPTERSLKALGGWGNGVWLKYCERKYVFAFRLLVSELDWTARYISICTLVLHVYMQMYSIHTQVWSCAQQTARSCFATFYHRHMLQQ